MRALDILSRHTTVLPDPRGVALVLHGGVQVSIQPVGPGSGSWRRATALGRAIAPRLAVTGVITYGLRYATRGWNAQLGRPAPLADARWALARIREEHPDTPVVLLGHSMGARVAVAVADDEAVAGLVGLAPWWPMDEPVTTLAGRHVIAAHGERDRITSARATRALLARAAPIAASTRYVTMGPVGHYMLSRIRQWNRTALESALAILEGA